MRKVLLTIEWRVCCCAGAARDEQSNDWEKQFQFRLEGLDKLMQGMDNLLQSIPRYQARSSTRTAIIIRRAPPEREFDPSVRPRSRNSWISEQAPPTLRHSRLRGHRRNTAYTELPREAGEGWGGVDLSQYGVGAP